MKRGDKVYLLRRNIRTTRPSDKLDHVKIGPFKIAKKISPVNYKLELPTGMWIHPIFHVSLLEKALANAKLQTKIELETNDDEYQVENILGHRLVDGRKQYLVKWKGYDNSDNTWEPVDNLMNCWTLVKRYHQQNRPSRFDRSQDQKATNRRRRFPVEGRTIAKLEHLKPQGTQTPRLMPARWQSSHAHGTPRDHADGEDGTPEQVTRELWTRRPGRDRLPPAPLPRKRECSPRPDGSPSQDALSQNRVASLSNKSGRKGREAGNEQSALETTRSHLRPQAMQLEQRPDTRSTTQSERDCRQREQGVGIFRPRRKTRSANSRRRNEEPGLGIGDLYQERRDWKDFHPGWKEGK